MNKEKNLEIEENIIEIEKGKEKEKKENEVVTKKTPKIEKTENPIYSLKEIQWLYDFNTNQTKSVKIVTQNINGPCPLIALCNILILRGNIIVKLSKKEISYNEIIELIGDYIIRKNANDEKYKNKLDVQYNFQDVLNIIPTLQKGLDINVKFDSVQSFEYSSAQLVFDFFEIKLFHGWTVDPEDTETYDIIVKKCGSYNKVVEKIIEADSACSSRNDLNSENESEENIKKKVEKEELIHIGLVCKNFLESTANQLTYHGLISIPEKLNIGELTVFFRNNHFLTLIKAPDGNMYTLVTDQGFSNKNNIVWESLSTIDGDSVFTNGLFKKYVEAVEKEQYLSENQNKNQNLTEDYDYALALSMQNEENLKANKFHNQNVTNMKGNNINLNYLNSLNSSNSQERKNTNNISAKNSHHQHNHNYIHQDNSFEENKNKSLNINPTKKDNEKCILM